MPDITRQVEDVVARAGVASGICFVHVPHTTAGVGFNETHDRDVARDILHSLSDLVPAARDYRDAEGNAGAHARAMLVGSRVLLPVRDGRLASGTWQGVLFCEFDGPGRRRAGASVVTETVSRLQ